MTTSGAVILNAGRIFYGLPGVNVKQKIYWSDLLKVCSKGNLSESEFNLFESKGSARSIRSLHEMKALLSEMPEDESAKIYALLSIFNNHLNAIQAENYPEVEQYLSHLKPTNSDWEKFASEFAAILNKDKARVGITIRANLTPLYLDFAVRCMLLFFLSAIPDGTIIVMNSSLIPIVILIASQIIGRKDKEINESLLESAGGYGAFRIRYQLTTRQYTLLAAMVLIGSYINYILFGGYVGPAIFFPLYYFIYIRYFCLGRLSRTDVDQSMSRNSKEKANLNADENDVALVQLETRLNTTTSRLDAYVLESALFGALSFSGFLQIMSDNQVSFEILENFSLKIQEFSAAFLRGEGTMASTALAQLNTKENLFCLLSFECLLCSIFFLGVIATRLRFSGIADSVQLALNLSKAFNQKEEALLHSNGVSDTERFQKINQHVNSHLHQGELVIARMEPVITIMQYLRNAGLLTFLLILICSGLFISPAISLAFIALSFAGWIYFNGPQIQMQIRYIIMWIRTSLVNRSLIILSSLAALLVLIFWLHFENIPVPAANLILLIALVLAVYIFLLMVLYPHVDTTFGEIKGQADQWSDGKWTLVKVPMAFFSSLSIMGIALKIFRAEGANPTIMISLLSIASLVSIFALFLSRPWWIGLIVAFGLSTNLIGSIFKLLHLQGANEMVWVGLVGTAISIIIALAVRKRLHRLLIIYFLSFLVLDMVIVLGGIDKLSMAYAHRDWKSVRILDDISEINEWQFPPDGLSSTERFEKQTGQESKTLLRSITTKGHDYLAKYGTRAGFTRYHTQLAVLLVQNSPSTGSVITQQLGKGDSTWAAPALTSTKISLEILKKFPPDVVLQNLDESDIRQILELHRKLLIMSGQSNMSNEVDSLAIAYKIDNLVR